MNHGQVGAITVRAQMLERFLAKVAHTVGITLMYNQEFVAFCPAGNRRENDASQQDELPGGRALFHSVQADPPASRTLPAANDTASFWCSRPTSALKKRFHPSRDMRERSGDENDDDDELFIWLDFDVLVGADGTKSRVRRFAGLRYVAQTSFHLGNKSITLSEVSQTSIILNFAPHPTPSEDGQEVVSCPHINPRVEQDFAGLAVDGVTSVFKR